MHFYGVAVILGINGNKPSTSNMPESSIPANPTENWLNAKVSKPYAYNRRKYIRYARNDLVASILKLGLLDLAKFRNREIRVTVLDISSRGALVRGDSKISVNKDIILTVRFQDSKECRMLGKIIRRASDDVLTYGIVFKKTSDQLSRYLLLSKLRG